MIAYTYLGSVEAEDRDFDVKIAYRPTVSLLFANNSEIVSGVLCDRITNLKVKGNIALRTVIRLKHEQ